MTEPKPCERCGSDFTPYRASSRYCSRSCAASGPRRRADATRPKPCAYCGKTYKPSHNEKGKYCSFECSVKGRGQRKPETVKSYRPLRTAKGHPIAPPSGLVPVARLNLYDKIGPGVHPCNWCDDPVSWDAPRYSPEELMADHVDWNTSNDAPGNLVPSCNTCNSNRRSGQEWRGVAGRIKDGELTIQLGNARTRAAQVICAQCGHEYLVRLSLVATPQLCSAQCRKRYET